MKRNVLLVVFILIFLSFSASVQANQSKSKTAPELDESKLSKLSVTHHAINIGNISLTYKATAGNVLIRDEKTGKLQATIFFMAYTKTPVNKKNSFKNRPVTFVFNGGPGSASLWLHMGGLGPKRVKMSDQGFQLQQPFEYIDNNATWLTFTDLVFIDPVSTGYSRLAPGAKGELFFGLQQDVESVGEFIRRYVTLNNRWLSPKYLCGESYGTTRAAGLANYLQNAYGMFLQGVVLVSSVLNFQTARFTSGNDLPYALFLPTFTASAWYHKQLDAKLQADLSTTLAEVEKWALTDYMVALARGDRISDKDKEAVVKRLSAYTGLSEKDVLRADMRISQDFFTRTIKRDEKKRIGRLDSRFVGHVIELSDATMGDDPSYAAILGPYAAAVQHYLRTELKYNTDKDYRAISEKTWPWDWGRGNEFVNVAEDLKQAMVTNTNLNVMIANGYYDLATPYFATDYTVSHMGLPTNLRKNVTMTYYQSGHMMYIHKDSLIKLTKDAARFYKITNNK